MGNEQFTGTEWKTIDCGIGNIEYEVPSNILLAEMMENLEKAIVKSTPKRINEILEQLT